MKPAPPRLPLLLLLAWLLISMVWWALAFLRAGAATPDWLARTQYVCFGTLESGLPDTYGWMTLIVGPTGMLGVLCALYWSELGPALRHLGSRLPGQVFAGVLLSLVALQGYWIGGRIVDGLATQALFTRFPQLGALPVNYPTSDLPLPDFDLIDQHGVRITPASLRGSPVLLTFAFGHCKTVCGLVVRSAVSAARNTADLGTRVVVVTLDPWRDTPGSLPAIAEQWGLQGLGHVLGGSVAQVTQVLERYRVVSRRDTHTGDIEHPPLVYAVRPSGTVAYVFSNPSPGWMAQAAQRSVLPPD